MSDTDPALAPIEGVDLETDAKAGATTQEAAAQVAEGAGVPAGKWRAVGGGWVTRMRESMSVRTAFGNLYTKY